MASRDVDLSICSLRNLHYDHGRSREAAETVGTRVAVSSQAVSCQSYSQRTWCGVSPCLLTVQGSAHGLSDSITRGTAEKRAWW
jgi:hypothetical protein